MTSPPCRWRRRRCASVVLDTTTEELVAKLPARTMSDPSLDPEAWCRSRGRAMGRPNHGRGHWRAEGIDDAAAQAKAS